MVCVCMRAGCIVTVNAVGSHYGTMAAGHSVKLPVGYTLSRAARAYTAHVHAHARTHTNTLRIRHRMYYTQTHVRHCRD